MSIFRKVAMAAAAVASVSLATAYAANGKQAHAASASPITIGASLSLSGDFASDGQAFQRGYQLWVADQNKAGGLLGHQIKLDMLSDASSPAQVVDQLPEADRLRPRCARVRTVLVAADGSRGPDRRALRLRVRRGRGRRADGVRRRTAQRLRRVDPGQGQPRDVRPVDRVAADVEAPEDGRLRDRQRPVHAAAVARSPRRSSRTAGVKTVLNKVFPEPRSPTTPRSPARSPRANARPGRARIGRRPDRLGLHARVHPAALQPQGVHRDRRARPGRAVRQGGRHRQRERHLRAQRLVRRLQEGRLREDGQGVHRQVRRQRPSERQRRRRRGLLGRPGAGAGGRGHRTASTSRRSSPT